MCLFDLISLSDFRGKWPLKWKFSKMSFLIHRRDQICNGENRPLRSCRKVAWFTKQNKLWSRGNSPSPHFGQNGPIAPKIIWTLSPLDLSTYTEFGPDRLRFAGLTPERLIFRPKKSIQYIRFQPAINKYSDDMVTPWNVTPQHVAVTFTPVLLL